MTVRYRHLFNVKQIDYDWQSNMMRKALPARAFYNDLTSNVILSMQAILVKGFSTVDIIRTYFRS